MSIKAIESNYEFYHNPQKGVCVAKITDHDAIALVMDEVQRIQDKMDKRGMNVNIIEAAIQSLDKVYPKEGFIARARCNFDCGDEYSFEIAEAISGARLTAKYITFVADVMSGVYDKIDEAMYFIEREVEKARYREDCAYDRIDNIWERFDI